MTILTKSFSEKKGDKLDVPLVDNEQLPHPNAPEDVEAQSHPRIIIFPARAHRVSTLTTLCLLLTALIVVGIGIFGGKMLYKEYLSISRQMQSEKGYDEDFQEIGLLKTEWSAPVFRGWAQIPMQEESIDDSTINIFDGSQVGNMNEDPEIKKILNDFFQENFEIDNEKKYEKIDVPDFRDERNGRFIHDFNTNITGIIDVTGHRCFVMPLNRENVLPPKSLFDLIHKMWEGYYNVDTTVVRKSMMVVVPPITDTKSIGSYIANECTGLPIYKLEKYQSGVVKRSAELHSEAKFAQFAGKGITELDIVNLDEVVAYEKHLKNQ